MTKWERVEAYIDTLIPGGSFTSHDYAAAEGISRTKASDHIQAYLHAQRGERARTKYVVRREPGTRTKSTQWRFGQRVRDAKHVGKAFSDDVLAKAMRAFEPDLTRIAALNPRAAKQVERQLKATMENAIALLSMAVQGMVPDDDE